jgi:hypothetical protein
VGDLLRTVMKPLSSLKLTVWLLGMLIWLVFAGTWAQIDMGIWQTLETYFRSLYVFIPFQIFLPRHWDVPGGLPFPGGLTLGTLLFFNLLAAHMARFKVNKKRLGVVLIHISLLMLIAGEAVTGMFAEESRMSIDEGATVSFAEDTREVELAFIDPSDPDFDRVIAIPEAMLSRGKTIRDPRLPFTIEIDAWYPNSDLVETAEAPPGPRPDRGTAVTHDLVPVPRAVVSGVEQNVIDLPAAVITLHAGEERLGTWMAPLWLSLIPQPQIQPVMVDGKEWRMALRYKRAYKDYAIHLIDFKHDRYLGTDTPKNYSSQVRLLDPARGENREVLIYMNNPLRYRGETFYQASFKQGDTGTILQIVRNPGWLLPYVACTIGAIGLCVQFGASLGRFLGKRRVAA